MRLAFLVGAGASIPAEMPTTARITETVLNGNGFIRHSDQKFYRAAPLNGEDVCPHVNAASMYLKLLKSEIEKYYESAKTLPKFYRQHASINYEDLYYVTAQLRDSESDEYDNPAVQPMIRALEVNVELSAFRANLGYGLDEYSTLSTFHRNACAFIEAVVSNALSREPACLPMTSLLSDATADSICDITHIFTLNHDQVLEKTLDKIGLPYSDGFGAAKDGLRRWTPSLLDDGNQIKLLKLHGDIRWCSIPLDYPDWRSRQVCIVEDPAVWDQQPVETIVQDHPGFLLGTHNKLFSYSGTIFADLYFRFFQALENIDAIVVVGYSFGDKGINTRLLDWVHAAEDHRMVVIDPNPSELQRCARGAVRRVLEKGGLPLLPKKLEDMNWGEVTSLLARDAV